MTGSCLKHKRLLGSLKILDLSFCQQLHSLGGFIEAPALERLILKNCISLIDVCESIEQCVELIHIDLSYCEKVKKLSTGKLRKVKTLLLEGCNSQTEMYDMNSSYVSSNSSYGVMEATASDFMFFAISLPSSLVFLSLANNNLSGESFPTDMSFLSMLEELCLDNNPIVSMPNCIRSLPRLKELSMRYCDKLISIEHPPPTLGRLPIEPSLYHSKVKKIKFDPKMSPLNFNGGRKTLEPWSFEIDGMVKIQPLVDVDEKVLYSLGWKNLESIKEKPLGTCYFTGSNTSPKTQMHYEFGIFSTFYEGNEMPEWIELTSEGASISFTIPSSKKLHGLTFCCVEMHPLHNLFMLPMIKVSNITKDYTWIYDHYVDQFELGGKYINFLSHWMFGPNEMESDDEIIITVKEIPNPVRNTQVTKICGVRLVYEDEMIEDALHYYKSWNHIIGGDLSGFQLTTGEYLLYNMRFMNSTNTSPFGSLIAHGSSFKGEVEFKAFSQNKPEILGQPRKGEMNDGSGVLVVPRQPVVAVSPSAAYSSTPAMGIPTPSPFSFSVASTRWSSSRPYNHVFGLVLRALMMAFSFGSSLALAVTMSNNSQLDSNKQGFQHHPELVYSFIITSLAFIYSTYQLFKGIWDIAFNEALITDKTSDYTNFILDQLAGYLLVSCSAVTALMINQQPLSGKTSLKKAATASVCLSVAAFLMTAVSAILSGYKLSKRVMW
ncbi:hypothetical protein M8C21_020957 [Ambrosia artemisiifolia]|uniref:CASP-like protein n=1 Tax=Ambrosia artemisiifolia TaxID=4212 RepID=A0AAD5CNE2_AMBAR|nr:hypothetical protein M8C21_020957 [Ambrosia artemisiifolia]